MIDLYSSETPNGWKISIALEELGLPYTVKALKLSKQEQKTPEYLRLNPNGRIPTIVDRDHDDEAHMSTFVLVHGAWHGAWCWYKVIPALERAGHTVIAPDLAGLGMDKTAATQITLHRWVADVCAILDRQNEPVILVGHSRGGIVISEVAQARPHHIHMLVYLTAFLVPNGKTLLDITQHDNVAQRIMRFDAVAQSVSLDLAAVQSVFYGDCSEQDVTLARLLLAPEPATPLSTPLQLTDDGFGRVPRVYIECTRDQAIAPALQRGMQAALPCRAVLSIGSDHSPFLSRPDELVQCLLRVAAT